VDVYDMTRAVQVVSYIGFIGEFGSGVLGGGLSKRWNNAAVEVFTTGGYGENCLSGLRAVGCRNVAHREIRDRDGKVERTDLGLKETEATRMEHAGALIEAFAAARAGHPYLTIRSRRDLAQLLDIQLDDQNRVVRVPGIHHGEALVVCGRFARLCSPEKHRVSIHPASQKFPESPVDVFRREAGLPPRPRTGWQRREVLRPRQRAR
jgi:hypothetical protein